MYFCVFLNHEHTPFNTTKRPGDVFHPSFHNGKPGYFDVTVRNTLQPAFLLQGAERAGFAAEAGVAAKDQLHATAVEESGNEFYPIVIESFGVWAPCSLITLWEIASRATTYTGLPIKIPGPHQSHAAAVRCPLAIMQGC